MHSINIQMFLNGLNGSRFNRASPTPFSGAGAGGGDPSRIPQDWGGNSTGQVEGDLIEAKPLPGGLIQSRPTTRLSVGGVSSTRPRLKKMTKKRLSNSQIAQEKPLSQDDAVEPRLQSSEQKHAYAGDQRGGRDHEEGDDVFGSATTVVWENVLLVTIIYNFVTFCYFLGMPGRPQGLWTYLEFLTEIVLVLDIFLRFALIRFLDPRQKKGQWRNMNLLSVKSDDKVLGMSLLCLSSLPTSIVMQQTVGPASHPEIWLALVRGLKQYRMKQLYLYFDVRDIRSRKNSFIRTLEASLYILMATHLLTCFWLFVGRVEPEQDINWFRLVQYDQYEGQVPQAQKYIDSAFFVVSSMTGLGFAYIYPETTLEYAMQSLIMLLGVSLYANFFAFFAVTIYNRNKKRIENIMKFEESKQLAVLRSFPPDIRSSMRIFYNSLRLKFLQFCDKYHIIEELPSSLRSEMSLFINSDLIQKINFFQFAEPSLILKFSKCLQPHLTLQDDFVVMQGEVATKLFFIKSGVIQVLATDNKTVIAFMSEGTYFGEIGVLLTQKRTCSIQAKTVSVFLTVEKDDLLSVLEESPLHLKYLRAVAKQRLQTTHPEDLVDKDLGFDHLLKHQLLLHQERMKTQEFQHHFTLYSSPSVSEVQSPSQTPVKPPEDQAPEEEGLQIAQNSKLKRRWWYLTEAYQNVNAFIIIPFSLLNNVWTPIFTIAMIYNILFVPFSIGLSYDIPGWYIVIDIIAVLVTFGDSILRPFLAVDGNLEIQTDKEKLLKLYVKHYFTLDLLATIPFDYIIMIIESSVYVRYFRLLRLLKLYRLIEIGSIINQHTTVNVPIFRIFVLFVSFILVSHWFNCIMILFAKWELGAGRRFDGKSLISYLQRSSSVKLPPVEEWTAWQLYFNLLILSVCFMGSVMYGDIIPFTMSEEIISLFWMILGRVFIAFLFAEMSSYVSQQYKNYNDHLNERNRVLQWIQLNGINPELKGRVQSYFQLKWKNQKGVQEEELIGDLPPSLRKNVKNFIFDELIQNCELFPRDNQGAITTITNRLTRILVPKDEFVIKQGELAADMYFIMKGEVRVVTKDGMTLAVLGKNKHFGEMALIQETLSVRSTSIVANTNVQLAVLSRSNFKLICTHYPEFKTRVQAIVDQRTKDSLKKGINITNQVQETPTPPGAPEESLASTQLRLRSQPTAARKDRRRLRAPQLSMIEEESRRGGDSVGGVSRSHSLNNSAVVSQARGGPTAVGATHLHQVAQGNNGLRPGGSGMEEEKAQQRMNRSKQLSSRKLSPEVDRGLFRKRHTDPLKRSKSMKGGQKRLSMHESKFENIIESVDEDDQQFQPSTSAAAAAVQEAFFLQQSLEDQEDNKQCQELKESSEEDNNNSEEEEEENGMDTLFEKSEIHFEPPGADMAADTQGAKKEEDQHTPRDVHSSTALNTDTGLISTKSEKPPEKDLYKLARLQNIPRLSSSMRSFEEYLWQVRGDSTQQQVSFSSMLSIFAFKYFLIFPLSVYNIVFIPLQMGFSLPFTGWYLFAEILTIITYTLDVLFIFRHLRFMRKQCLQMTVPSESTMFRDRVSCNQSAGNFQTGLPYDREEIELKIKRFRTELLVSLVSTLPFSLILQNVKNFLFIVNFFRILRLLKLHPLYRVLQYLKRYSVNLIRLVEIIVSYYLVAHIVSGVMLSVGLASAPDISDTWLNKVPVPLPSDKGPKQTDSTTVDLDTFYIHAIYFAANTISHVAIGDLTAVTTEERVLNAFIITMLTFFYALIFANISSIFSSNDNFLSFNEKYQHVRKTVPKKKLTPELSQKIDDYFDYLWYTTQGYDEQKDILGGLPNQLKHDLIRERYYEGFENSLLFKCERGLETNVAIMNSFIERIQIKIFMARDFVVKGGSFGDSLYLILDGQAVVFGMNNEILSILRPGAHFSTDITADNFNYQGKRIFHVVAQSLLTVAEIDREHMNMLIEAFPAWLGLIQKLNQYIYDKAKMSLSILTSPLVRQFPMMDESKIEMKALEEHLTTSTHAAVYSEILAQFDSNGFLYDHDSPEYKKYDWLEKQENMVLGLSKTARGLGSDNHMQRGVKRESSATMMHFSQLQFKMSSADKLLHNGRCGNFKRCLNRILINRLSTFRTILEFIHMLNLIYIGIAVPFSIIFINYEDNVSRIVFIVFESISVFIQLFIIGINLRTPIVADGEITVSIKLVFRNYLKRGFILDFLGALPLNLIFGGLLPPMGPKALIAFVRLLRVCAVFKIAQLYQKFQVHLKNYSVSIVSLRAILFLFFLSHWTTCIWYFINILEYDSYEVTWFKQFNVLSKSIGQQYLLSFYFVIKIVTGVGQSDMIAYNNLERICFIIIINIGDALFAIAFGLIAQVQMHIAQNSKFQQYISKMKVVEEFLVDIEAQDSQRKRVEQYYSYSFYAKQKKQIFSGDDLEGFLPESMIKDVLQASQQDYLKHMFKGEGKSASENLIKELSAVLTHQIYMTGDYIILKDQLGEEMYFIIEGQVQVIASDKTTVLKTLRKGSYFGEIALFTQNVNRVAFVQAKTPCIIGILRKADVENIVRSFPNLAKQFKLEALKRMAETQLFEDRKRASQAEQDSSDSSQSDSSHSEDANFDESFIRELEFKLQEGSMTPLAVDAGASSYGFTTQRSLMKNIKRQSFNYAGMEDYIKGARRSNTALVQEYPDTTPVNGGSSLGSFDQALEAILTQQKNKPNQITTQDSPSFRQASSLRSLNRKQKTYSSPIRMLIDEGKFEEVQEEDDEQDDLELQRGQPRPDHLIFKDHLFSNEGQIQEEVSSSEESCDSGESFNNKVSPLPPGEANLQNDGKNMSGTDKQDDTSEFQLKSRWSTVLAQPHLQNKDANADGIEHQLSNSSSNRGPSSAPSFGLVESFPENDEALSSLPPLGRMNQENNQQLHQFDLQFPNTPSLSQKRVEDQFTFSPVAAAAPNTQAKFERLEGGGRNDGSEAGHNSWFSKHHPTNPFNFDGINSKIQVGNGRQRSQSVLGHRHQQHQTSTVSRKYSHNILKSCLDQHSHQKNTIVHFENEEEVPLSQRCNDKDDLPMSIRRYGKKHKKPKRRLSQIKMGKMLMLSNTAGLKLQWTVGQQ